MCMFACVHLNSTDTGTGTRTDTETETDTHTDTDTDTNTDTDTALRADAHQLKESQHSLGVAAQQTQGQIPL